MNIPQISNAEFEVMKIVWEYAPISTNDVVAALNTTEWSPKTIQTMLLRLTKKGALTYEKSGRSYIYSPLIKKADYLSSTNRSFLERFYNGNLKSMVLSFLKEEALSEEDFDELKQILDKRNEA